MFAVKTFSCVCGGGGGGFSEGGQFKFTSV